MPPTGDMKRAALLRELQVAIAALPPDRRRVLLRELGAGRLDVAPSPPAPPAGLDPGPDAAGPREGVAVARNTHRPPAQEMVGALSPRRRKRRSP